MCSTYGVFFFQRVAAAFLAIAVRRFGVREAARASPPFNPPLRPAVAFADAFGFTASPVACCITSKAICVKSLRGMGQFYASLARARAKL